MCIELVELITIWGAILGRRNEELSKSSLLMGLLWGGRERRRWQREWRTVGSRRNLAWTGSGKCGHLDRRASTRCGWGVQINTEGLGRGFRYDQYLRDRLLHLDRSRLLGSHEINATLNGHGQVFSFAGTIDRGRSEPGPSIDRHLSEFIQIEASGRLETCPKIPTLVPDRIVLLNFERGSWDRIGAIVPVVY